jgi:hypothetical protein
LHTVSAPTISADGFAVTVAPQEQPGHAGGTLTGKVLLPRAAVINAVGGHGLEFFVDDRNYDENGTLHETNRKRRLGEGEPGRWRIEVAPAQDATDDQFLVVMLPAAWGNAPTHRVRLLESGKRVGCEVVGPNRTVRWWFDPGRNNAEVEVLAGGDSHRYTVTGAETPPPDGSGWLPRIRNLFRAGTDERR